ncbi:hypothetical protein NXS98_14635 [Fontisphaera persica]|uniref:hypothetical protein n=1 Tax=Fontisphaera persica TaxID=2974023 RepID=UPI0024C0E5CE|nr:hypothetical protein [Fontisphaera persica]WCJ58939.1 hypothetical protein NXS98_14635 [Fontisphaera persica]
MSESQPLLDLERMFLPAWAKEAPPANRFDHYTGEEESGGRRRGPGRRREGQGDQRRPDRGPAPNRGGQRAPAHAGEPGQRPPRGRRDQRRPGPPRPVEREPLPKVKVGITIEDKVADSLARQIRATGRSYPIFDLARLILQKNDRFLIRFNVIKNNSGAPEQPLYRCALDETVWTDKEEALQYLLDKHFDTFYQAERTPTNPPKGVYTFVAVCDLNGAILGPPNYHGYQEELRRLHREHYAHMPLEAFKAKIRIVRDEAVVKKWIEDQSWKTEYLCLNVPEAPRLADRESVVAHFREVHLPLILQEVESHAINGQAALQLPCRGLRRLAWQLIERQRRFPLELVHSLSALFNERKLQFFKLDKDITHVGVARPHYLDLETSIVSDNVRRIIQFIQQNPGSNRQKLMEALAPAPAPAPAPVPMPEGSAAPGEAAPPAPEPTPEQMALISDLHWLVHQGHVIELANGTLLTAKKPAPKPPKPAPAPAAPAPEAAAPAPADGNADVPPAETTLPVPPLEAPAAAPAEAETSESAVAESTADVSAPVAEAPAAEPGTETPVIESARQPVEGA